MPDLSTTWVGWTCLCLFALVYLLVVTEEKTRLRKSKPVMVAGFLMWALIGFYTLYHPQEDHVREAVHQLSEEVSELFFFLLVAMTYIHTLAHLNVFAVMRDRLIHLGFNYRQLFWATGITSFFISAIADNLTTALLMATLVHAVAANQKKALVPMFINIVVAANAGGAWSPFGDITSLMLWTAHKVPTFSFGYLILPSLVCWLIPAAFLARAIPNTYPEPVEEHARLKPGAKLCIFLGLLSLVISIVFHQLLQLPAYQGMMLGLGLLMLAGYRIQELELRRLKESEEEETSEEILNIFSKIGMADFDTLLFFFGILISVGALDYLGHLHQLNVLLYQDLGPVVANTTVGVLSAIVDNIPLMFAIIKTTPQMGLDQWLLLALTTGTGGSLLSIGSAAGVAVMGVDRENYTFSAHLKWAPVIALGYFAGVITLLLIT